MVSKLVDLALHDLKDDIVRLVPQWREKKGPLQGIGDSEGSPDRGIPRIYIHVKVWLGDEADAQEKKDQMESQDRNKKPSTHEEIPATDD
ncbi:MAG: hypothetical protein V3T54_01325 [Acidobacteriota bacterium]